MAEKLKLTDKLIRETNMTGKERSELQDTEIPELRIRIGGSVKTFFLYKKINNAPKRITIGKFPTLTVFQAREQARIQLGRLALGENIADERKITREKTAITVTVAFHDYLASRKSLKPRTRGIYTWAIEKCLGDWKHRPLGEISERDIERRYNDLAEETPGNAGNVMRTLRAVYNFARYEYRGPKDEILFPVNPVGLLSHKKAWVRLEPRQTCLDKESLPKFWKLLCGLRTAGGTKETLADCLEFLLLTGTRKLEAMTLEWSMVDFERRSIFILETKNKQPHCIPMTRQLEALLLRRKNTSWGSKFVFPGEGKTGHLIEPRGMLKAIQKGAGIIMDRAKPETPIRPHDFRRTFLTIGELYAGVDRVISKRLINHKDGSVTGGYLVANFETLREPMQRVNDAIMRIAEETPGGKILEFRKAN